MSAIGRPNNTCMSWCSGRQTARSLPRHLNMMLHNVSQFKPKTQLEFWCLKKKKKKDWWEQWFNTTWGRLLCKDKLLLSVFLFQIHVGNVFESHSSPWKICFTSSSSWIYLPSIKFLLPAAFCTCIGCYMQLVKQTIFMTESWRNPPSHYPPFSSSST